MDRIVIEDLLLRCIVGVNPEERTKLQDVNLQVTLYADLRPAGRSDDLADTIDYKGLKGDIRALVEGSSYLLIERLAHEVARQCLRRPGVERVQVRVEKPGALRFARTVAVVVERSRSDYPETSAW
ncbi:MAG: dihydroneopterin aldolase [Lentisphaerae bacterium]|nr:dihydroneopterin aldolase [Lentisphaerota bacterium]